VTKKSVRLDAALLEEAKQVAAGQGRSLTAFVEEAVRESLARHQRRGPTRKWVKLPTSGGGGLLPGVTLGDSSSF
jgi:hypothetical protein